MSKTRYFSEQHTTKASQLAGSAVTVGDSPAVAELRAALADYPTDYNLYLQLAHQLGQQLRYHEAIEVLTAAVALRPGDPTAYRRRAPRFFSTLQFDRALADYQFCAAATPDSLDVLYRLGILLVAMQDYPRAKPVLARCIEITRDSGDDEMLVGAIYWYLAAWLRCHDTGEPNLGEAAYRDDIAAGHHFAYHTGMRLLLGKLSPAEAEAVITDEVDDLDCSMILYAVYLHHYTAGNEQAARATMERLLARDYYWAGFAYIAALADSRVGVTVPPELQAFFAAHPRLALAFSGGADSSYLLYAARQCGCDVTAYYVHSQFQPQFELEDARKLADQLQAPLRVLELDVLQNSTVAQNPADRCYHCKRVIFGQILAAAQADGYPLVTDGTNASDDADDRPGMRALAELEVLSPLRLCGVSKTELRRLSREAGLFTWNKPAYACLATRVPTGRAITAADLARVESGECYLMERGFSDLRLRLQGEGARLELPENQLDRLIAMRREIYEGLSVWFAQLLLDMKPRATGGVLDE